MKAIRFLQGWFNTTFRRKRLCDKLRLTSFTYKTDEELGAFNAEIRFKHPDFYLITAAMVKLFRDSGAINFVDFTGIDPATMEAFTISIQRWCGKTAGEIVGILRSALEQIESGCDDPQGIARQALDKCGYRKAAEQ